MEELNRLYGIYKKKYQEKEYREKKKYGALYKSPEGGMLNRGEFYKDLDKHGLDEHIQKYIKVTAKDRFLESVKGIAYKGGLMETLRKLKGC